MSEWAGRKGQSLTVRALWRFGPAAATAVLLAVPSLPGSSHSHSAGTGHRPVPATVRHIHRPSGTGTVRTGTVSTGTVSTGPGQASLPAAHRRPGHFIKPD
jgi:hypothetical protein